MTITTVSIDLAKNVFAALTNTVKLFWLNPKYLELPCLS